MSSMKHALYILILAGISLFIAFCITYNQTAYFMRGVNYIQESAYKR